MDDIHQNLFSMSKSYDDMIVNSINDGEITMEEGIRLSTENLKRSLDSLNVPNNDINNSPWLKSLSSSFSFERSPQSENNQ